MQFFKDRPEISLKDWNISNSTDRTNTRLPPSETAQFQTTQGWCCNSNYDIQVQTLKRHLCLCKCCQKVSFIIQPLLITHFFITGKDNQSEIRKRPLSGSSGFHTGCFYFFHCTPRLNIKRNPAITQVGEKKWYNWDNRQNNTKQNKQKQPSKGLLAITCKKKSLHIKDIWNSHTLINKATS